jgi:phosphohistidine phosphatase
MDLYLIRHADAVPLGEAGILEDSDRPLSETGKTQSKALAAALKRAGANVNRVLSSPALRAKQTADGVIAAWSGSVMPLETCDDLAMGFKPKKLAGVLEEYKDNAIALVGHQPDLAEFAAWLIGSRKARLDLAKGGVACISCSNGISKGSGTLEWLVTPAWY